MEWYEVIIIIGAVVAAISAIITAILKVAKPIKKLVDSVDGLMIANENRREEGTVLIKGLRATLDGLKQQGCNGSVTKASLELDEYIDKITETRK